MRRFLILLLLACSGLAAATFKLYLADGTFHMVREYKVNGDRVKYYSTERGDWEEIPTELVDLKKTEGERGDKAAKVAETARLISEEDKAVRAQQEEVLKIPQDPGVYLLEDGKTLRIFKLAESTYHTNKGRAILAKMVPVPLVPGKGTVEIAEPHSLNVVKEDRPDLYVQLSAEEHFGIVKLTPHGSVRIAEKVSVLQVVGEAEEVVEPVEIFRKQLTESGLYKIWPKEAMAPGEYAVIQYLPGKLNAQFWDFAIKR